jgi:hypothetical protein
MREKPLFTARQISQLTFELTGKVPRRPPLGEPWLREGVSRSTWYRNRRRKKIRKL